MVDMELTVDKPLHKESCQYFNITNIKVGLKKYMNCLNFEGFSMNIDTCQPEKMLFVVGNEAHFNGNFDWLRKLSKV